MCSFGSRKLAFLAACALLQNQLAFAESEDTTADKKSMKEVVVTANKMETEASKVGSSVTVISQKEIEQRKLSTVLEILKTVPGVDVVRSGGLGGNTTVFLRGANAEHTLVLIDGVEVNNPINPQRSYNFVDLSLDNVERIEILRGAQTTLYGSDALGGVIQIITKKGDRTPKYQLTSELGSYDTYREGVSASGSESGVNYSAAFARLDRQGMSSVKNETDDSENDKFEETIGSARLGGEVSENLGFDLTGRITSSHSEIDDGPGAGGDDPNRFFNSTQYSLRGTTNVSLFSGRLKQVYGVSYANTDYRDNDDPDPAHPLEKLRSRYFGEQLKFDMQNSIQLSEGNIFTFGLETEEEKGSSRLSSDSEFGPFVSNFAEKEVRTNGVYAQFALEPVENLNITLGGRVDDNSIFGTRENWRFSGSYLIAATGTRLKSSVGTAYKAPSLYQLYSEFGRLDLRPEKSLSVDGGFEQALIEDRLLGGITYFYNDFDDLISFDPNSFLFENILKAETQGIEAFFDLKATDELRFKTSYTYLDTEDGTTGLRLLRRAKHKVNIDMGYQVCKKLDTHLNLLVVGTRADNDFASFPAERVRLPAYAVMNLSAEYQVHENIAWFLRGDNIFDKDYQEVFGYNTPGAVFTTGLKVGVF